MERRPLDRVRGTQDLWPADARQLEIVRRQLETCFEAFGYRRVDVPVLEPAELHLRKSGLEIISKLYAFEDQGGRRLCLRPELTASVVRALVAQPPPRLPVKVFSSGPVFRYERPSRGRFRQFTHADVELFGAPGPLADAEIVLLAMDALDRLGLTDYRVTIGHVGILAELLSKLGLTGRLRTSLMESLEQARRYGLDAVRLHLRELDPDLFDTPGQPASPPPAGADGGAAAVYALVPDDPAGDDQVRAAVAGLLAQIGAESLGRRTAADVVERMLRKLRPGSHHQAVQRALEFIGRLGGVRGDAESVFRAGRALLASYGLDDEPLRGLEQTIALLADSGADVRRVQLDLGLSRGLQYYTGMVFEIDHDGLGSESQLCGGGRYDDLFRALGTRQSLAALGFAFGVERVKLALEAEGKLSELPPVAGVFVVAAAPEHRGYAARVAQEVRRAGGRADLDVTGRSLRAGLAHAGREGYPLVAVVGEVEARQGVVRVREMSDGAERVLPLGAIGEFLSDRAAGAETAFGADSGRPRLATAALPTPGTPGGEAGETARRHDGRH